MLGGSPKHSNTTRPCSTSSCRSTPTSWTSAPWTRWRPDRHCRRRQTLRRLRSWRASRSGGRGRSRRRATTESSRR
ncbi:uncharacterized protein ACA1_034930 [Acanthamoeba castellanii str. Neff]|uniref:Uncharacterized protein n=1 Tax=Acanthamoeba castellanii (strain ATCC 30010 / Neff) TaxID=1257118 RepID=L8HD03_ACACF|nr:uncharacterized protein ACA1_034930 [Acanthamoeba castellanii str. Neff]ELR22618.1 hypothetical protein ACA1_034930 [Acanthamoeba castellanii str. Neff]